MIIKFARQSGKSLFMKKLKEEMSKKKKSKEDFEKEYMCIFDDIEAPYRTKCGDCKFFVGKCTTSRIEAKYGSANTPSCSEFEKRG